MTTRINTHFLDERFKESDKIEEGAIIVSEDGKYYAIVGWEAETYIHVREGETKVTSNEIGKIQKDFKGKYVYKTYHRK